MGRPKTYIKTPLIYLVEVKRLEGVLGELEPLLLAGELAPSEAAEEAGERVGVGLAIELAELPVGALLLQLDGAMAASMDGFPMNLLNSSSNLQSTSYCSTAPAWASPPAAIPPGDWISHVLAVTVELRISKPGHCK